MNSKPESPKVILLKISDGTEFPIDLVPLYHTHLVCESGRLQFLFGGKQMECKAGEFLFWFADSLLSNLSFSKKLKATVLLIEKRFLNDNVPDQSWSINAILHSRNYPVKYMSKQDQGKIYDNFNWLYERSLNERHLFYNEVLNHQMQIFILEMWNIFSQEYDRRKHTLQTGTLYEQFMLLIQEHCMQEREVQFYSDKLNITAKYLNQISKNNSGITASQWIQQYTKERIIILLQNKFLNISEIGDEMNFRSRSFFTSYVKKLLGMTPKEYRERL